MAKFNFHRKKPRRITSLNTTATADISFILLVFFLIVTSMDTDKGLNRQLPEMEKEKQEEVVNIDKNSLLNIKLETGGKVLINGSLVDKDSVGNKIKEFVLSVSKPEQHVLSVEVSEDVEYEQYFKLQNNILIVYKEMRDDYAKNKFNSVYRNLSEAQQLLVRKHIPIRIAEKLPEK